MFPGSRPSQPPAERAIAIPEIVPSGSSVGVGVGRARPAPADARNRPASAMGARRFMAQKLAFATPIGKYVPGGTAPGLELLPTRKAFGCDLFRSDRLRARRDRPLG